MYEPLYDNEPRSKKLAEERAWELAKGQDRWRLVTINPAVIMGPPLANRADGESVGAWENDLRLQHAFGSRWF